MSIINVQVFYYYVQQAEEENELTVVVVYSSVLLKCFDPFSNFKFEFPVTVFSGDFWAQKTGETCSVPVQ